MEVEFKRSDIAHSGRRMKLIVIVGYENTGKTTLIKSLYKRLCWRSGGMLAGDYAYWCEAVVSAGRRVNIFFGENGDGPDCVSENLYEIAKRNASDDAPFDFAIIPLRRVDNESQSRSWMKWLGSAIDSIRGGLGGNPPIPNAFDNVDVYYVHTLWPQYFPVLGGTSLATPNTVTHPNVDVLSQITEDQIVSLIERM